MLIQQSRPAVLLRGGIFVRLPSAAAQFAAKPEGFSGGLRAPALAGARLWRRLRRRPPGFRKSRRCRKTRCTENLRTCRRVAKLRKCSVRLPSAAAKNPRRVNAAGIPSQLFKYHSTDLSASIILIFISRLCINSVTSTENSIVTTAARIKLSG